MIIVDILKIMKKYRLILSIILGTFSLAQFVILMFFLIYIYRMDAHKHFYASLVINIFLYLFDVFVYYKFPIMIFFTLFQCSWFRIPFLLKRSEPEYPFCLISYAIKFLQLIINTLSYSYYGFQTNYIPITFPIIYIVLSSFILPIFIEGILFMKCSKVSLTSYFLNVFAVALHSLFMGVFFTNNYFWILIVLSLAWRVFFIYDQYAFSCAFISIIDPFYAIRITYDCKNQIVHTNLIIEHFIYVIFCFAYERQTVLNTIIVVASLVAFIFFYFYIHLFQHAPWKHRIIPTHPYDDIEYI